MKAEDFAGWLSAISGMSEGQRTEAIAALEKASAVGAEGGGMACCRFRGRAVKLTPPFFRTQAG